MDETHLDVMRGLQNSEVSIKCINKEKSTERYGYNRHIKQIFFAIARPEQCLLGKIRKAFVLIRTINEVSEEAAMVGTYTISFLKKIIRVVC